MEKMSLPDGLDMYLTAEGVVVCQKCRIDWVIAACVFLAAWLGFFGHASCLAFAAGDSTKYASGLLLFEMGVVWVLLVVFLAVGCHDAQNAVIISKSGVKCATPSLKWFEDKVQEVAARDIRQVGV